MASEGWELIFFNKDLFNIWFYLTNLRQFRVINKGEVIEANRKDGIDKANKINGVDGTDGYRADRKKADWPGIVAKDIVVEDPNITPEDLAPEDISITLKDPTLEDPGIVLEDLVSENSGRVS